MHRVGPSQHLRLTLILALAVAVTMALAVASPARGAAKPVVSDAGGHAAAAKKKKCKKAKLARRKGKRRCRRIKKKAAPPVSVPTPPPPPASVPPQPAGPPPLSGFELTLVSRGGLWFEQDPDGDLVCNAYGFNFNGGVRGGVRTAYFVNIFTGQCRTSPPYAGQTPFTWSLTGNQLTVRFNSGFTEQITLGSYNATFDELDVARGANTNRWYGCLSPFSPFICV